MVKPCFIFQVVIEILWLNVVIIYRFNGRGLMVTHVSSSLLFLDYLPYICKRMKPSWMRVPNSMFRTENSYFNACKMTKMETFRVNTGLESLLTPYLCCLWCLPSFEIPNTSFSQDLFLSAWICHYNLAKFCFFFQTRVCPGAGGTFLLSYRLALQVNYLSKNYFVTVKLV